MSNESEKLIIFMTFEAVGRTYECGVSSHMTFRRLLSCLGDLLISEFRGRFRLSGNELIIESGQGTECDPDVSLRSLRVQSGMHFEIY